MHVDKSKKFVFERRKSIVLAIAIAVNIKIENRNFSDGCEESAKRTDYKDQLSKTTWNISWFYFENHSLAALFCSFKAYDVVDDDIYVLHDEAGSEREREMMRQKS